MWTEHGLKAVQLAMQDLNLFPLPSAFATTGARQKMAWPVLTIAAPRWRAQTNARLHCIRKGRRERQRHHSSCSHCHRASFLRSNISEGTTNMEVLTYNTSCNGTFETMLSGLCVSPPQQCIKAPSICTPEPWHPCLPQRSQAAVWPLLHLVDQTQGCSRSRRW